VEGYGSDRDSGAALERALRACHAANGGGADLETERMASTPGATPLPGDGVAGDRVSSDEVPELPFLGRLDPAAVSLPV
jgi:hypothetical protein